MEGGKPTLKEALKTNIKPEAQKKFHDIMHEAQNFFKHSGTKDADKSVKLHPFYTDVILLDGCNTYRLVTSERLPMLATFETWAAITWAKEFMTYPGPDVTKPGIVEWASMTPGKTSLRCSYQSPTRRWSRSRHVSRSLGLKASILSIEVRGVPESQKCG
jgi:hypothetical protein